MLSYVLSAVAIVCLAVALALFLQIRKYLNTHEGEEMSVVRKYLMPRITAMEILIVIATAASLIRILFF